MAAKKRTGSDKVTPTGAPLTEEGLLDEATTLFDHHAKVTRTELLVDLSGVSFDPKSGSGAFEVDVNCPDKWSDLVSGHEVVRRPLQAFLADIRERHPGIRFEIKIAFDPIDTGRGVEAALTAALRHAGANDLLVKLGLSRS